MNTEIPNAPTILCLINSAAFSRPYFEQLGEQLRKRGFRVVFALDSHLTDVVYANDQVLEKAWYFTDFVRQQIDSKVDVKDHLSQSNHSWRSLFSDFDRYLTMEIPPPLRPGGPLAYKDVPWLLELFFQHIFEQVRPDAVLYEPVSNSFAIAAYDQARCAGIPFCSMSPSRISGRIELSMTGALEDHVMIGALYRKSSVGSISEQSRDIARTYIESIDVQVPDYMKTNGLDRLSLMGKYANISKIAHFLKGWRYSRRHAHDCELAYQHGNPVVLSFAYFRRAFKRSLRFKRVQRLFSRGLITQPFFLYPLHFHPEASTSVYAADFIDELSVIKAIAFRLSTGMQLCVKEHPSAVALQPLSFYEQLAALPNVKLLGPGVHTKELIRRSSGVVCLTSTVGFEAAVLNKPVVVLGNVFYSYFPNVRAICDYSALSAAIEWALAYVPVPAVELIEATAAYVEFGTPGSFDFRASLGNTAALESMADLVARRLNPSS